VRLLAGIPLGLALWTSALALDVLYDFYPLAFSILVWGLTLAWAGMAVNVAISKEDK